MAAMSSIPSSSLGVAEPAKPTMSVNACEACRAAKVRCQPSAQLGTCKRCLTSKRECIFRTGPRLRRPRRSKYAIAPPRSPPPGPSKTFVLDIPVQGTEDVADDFASLRLAHEGYVDGLAGESGSGSSSGEDDFTFSASSAKENGSGNGQPRGTPMSLTSNTASLGSGPSVALNAARHMSTHSVQPQFNLASATSLLDSFRQHMLPIFPCIAIPAEATVPSLARDSPFLLLAILAAASGCRSLQGHNLYDGEFRRVLGLKRVTSGEVNLEILQGLLVYIAWYPFHLRPQRQATQYIRMAIEMLQELELDDDRYASVSLEAPSVEEARVALACYYLSSAPATAWNRAPELRFTDWTEQCCQVLESASTQNGSNSVLALLCRLQHIAEEARELVLSEAAESSEHQNILLRTGGDMQMAELKQRVAREVQLGTSPSVAIAISYTEMLDQAPALFENSKSAARRARPLGPLPSCARVSPERLAAAIPHMLHLVTYLAGLPRPTLNSLTSAVWSQIIKVIVALFRAAFAQPERCPDWDPAVHAAEVDFEAVLLQLVCLGEGEGKFEAGAARKETDVVAASRVVMEVVLTKFKEKRRRLQQREARDATRAATLALYPDFSAADWQSGGFDGTTLPPRHEQFSQQGMGNDRAVRGCPMFDPNLRQTIRQWSGEAGNETSSGTASLQDVDTSTSVWPAPAADGATAADEGMDEYGVGANLDPSLENFVDFNDPDIWLTLTSDWPDQSNQYWGAADG